jgi:hypothetical protein
MFGKTQAEGTLGTVTGGYMYHLSATRVDCGATTTQYRGKKSRIANEQRSLQKPFDMQTMLV